MKGFNLSKKILVFLICLLVAAFTVCASAVQVRNWTDVENTQSTNPVNHKHIYGEWVVTKQPTCKSEGERTRTCIFSATVDGEVKTCGHTYTEVLPVDPEVHTYDGNEVVIKAATCSSVGESEYTCTGCKKTVKVYSEKTAHTLDENEWIVVDPVHEATLERPGKRYNKCTVCNTEVTISIPVEHKYETEGTVVTAPTCVSKGERLQRCTVCGKNKMVDIDIDKNNHVYGGKALLIGEIDCKNPGKGIIKCEGCGVITTVVIPADTEHKYLEWEYREATGDCKTGSNGYLIKQCSECDKIFDEKTWSGHVLDENAKTHASTCSQPGYMKGKCTVCGLVDAEVMLPIDDGAHSWYEEVLIEPTCTTKGYVFRICKYDSSHVEYEYIDEIGHDYATSWTVTKEPSCYEQGMRTNVCINCGRTIEEIIEKDPDKHPDGLTWTTVKEPTCLEEGIERAYCRFCSGSDFVERKIPKHTNTLVEYSRKEATCCIDGEIVYDCYGCGEDVIKTIPRDPLAHKPGKAYYVTKKATCAEEGVLSKVCDYCLAPIEAISGEHAQKSIAKTNHIVTAWEVTKEPTCTEKGSKSRTCTECGHIETVSVPAEHRYKAWVVETEAKCNQAGVRTRGCYNCNKTWSENYYADHELGNWTAYKDASCENGGTFRKYCNNCHKAIVEKTVAKGEHVELIEQATEYKVSESICSRKQFKCTVCGGIEEVTTTHTLYKTSPEVAVTCEKNGVTAGYECYLCKIKILPKTIEATGHNFEYDEEGTKYCLNCNLYYVEGENGESKTCTHFCHNNGTIGKILTKVLTFFWKLLGINQECECGELHYETVVKGLKK